jgi:hypothetical protein
MASGRADFTATLLTDGKVLVAGGNYGTTALAASEIYDPATGGWEPTGSMHTARSSHGAWLLSSGKVLVAGGCTGGPCSTGTNTAEIYDPGTGSWTPTGGMSTLRYFFAGALLQTGKVLVVGGCSQSECAAATATAEIYDPSTGRWSSTGSTTLARSYHTATLLQSGNVLVAGGYTSAGAAAAAEMYSPATGKWSSAGSLVTGRAVHTATLLKNGKVLVTGGIATYGNILKTAEVFDPASRKWLSTGSMSQVRENHTASLLPGGRILVAGGYGKIIRSAVDLSSAELYDPATGTFSSTGSMTAARSQHAAVSLPDGRVLAAGGLGNSAGYQSSAEFYTP